MKLFGKYLFNTPRKHIKLAEKYYQEGKIKEAIEEYKKVLELDPKNNEIQERLRRIYRERESLLALLDLPGETQKEGEKVAEEKIEIQPGVWISERRKFKRLQYEIKYRGSINYRLLKGEGGIKGEGEIRNICAAGMYLVAKDDIKQGSFLELKFSFPTADNVIYAIGKVLRVDKIKENNEELFGIGIKFTNISPQEQERIDKFIQEHTDAK